MRLTPSIGYISGAWGQLKVSGASISGGSGDTFSRASVRGSVATMLSPGFGVQADALGDLMASPDTSIATVNGAVHVYARSPNHLFGAFGHWRGLGLGSGGEASFLFGGAEAQWYLGRVTLYGQVGAQQLSIVSSSNSTGSG